MVLNPLSLHHGLDDRLSLHQGHVVDQLVQIRPNEGLDAFEHTIEVTTIFDASDPLRTNNNLQDYDSKGLQVPFSAPNRLRCVLKLVCVRVGHETLLRHQVLTFLPHELRWISEDKFRKVVGEEDVLRIDVVQGGSDFFELLIGFEELEDDYPALLCHQLPFNEQIFQTKW